MARTGVEFVHTRTGKLVVYSTEKGFRGAVAQMGFQERLGCEQSAVNAAACLEIEPALVRIRDRLVGGIFTPSEQAGDCYRLCTGLESLLRTEPYGVTFTYGRTVSRFVCDRQRVLAVETDQGVIEGISQIQGTDTLSGARQFTMEIHVRSYEANTTEVSVFLRIQEESAAFSGATDLPLKDHALYDSFFTALQQALQGKPVGVTPANSAK